MLSDRRTDGYLCISRQDSHEVANVDSSPRVDRRIRALQLGILIIAFAKQNPSLNVHEIIGIKLNLPEPHQNMIQKAYNVM